VTEDTKSGDFLAKCKGDLISEKEGLQRKEIDQIESEGCFAVLLQVSRIGYKVFQYIHIYFSLPIFEKVRFPYRCFIYSCFC